MFSSALWYCEDIEYIAGFNIDWNRLSGRSILITGATGLIGTVLVDAIMYKNSKEQLGIKVLALARDKERVNRRFASYQSNTLFKVIQGDVSKPLNIDKSVDFIINLASNTHPVLYATEPINTIDSIVGGVKNILEFSSRNNVERVINISSVEVYGENRGDVERFTEDYCGYINCNTLRAGYSEGKRLAEALCQAYIVERNTDVISTRLGRVYGASFLDSDTKSTSQFIRNAANSEDIILKSEGKQKYSYIYVADAVTALLLLLSSGEAGEAYNVSHDEVKTFRDVAELLAGINGRKVTYDIPTELDRTGFSVVQNALMDSSKMKSLGWQAEYDLRNGLERTVRIVKSRDGE